MENEIVHANPHQNQEQTPKLSIFCKIALLQSLDIFQWLKKTHLQCMFFMCKRTRLSKDSVPLLA